MPVLDSIVVVATGAPPATVRAEATGRVVIAADGGLEAALAADVVPDLVIGDFDSVGADELAEAERRGAALERHPVAKDATDLELALDAARDRGARRALVLGSSGGRLDHLLAAGLGLAADRYAGMEVDAILGAARVSVVRRRRAITGSPGELVSLLAVHGPAVGIVTAGLRYPLRGETLEPGSSRGVSNVFEAPEARIAVDHGVLLAVRPESEG